MNSIQIVQIISNPFMLIRKYHEAHEMAPPRFYLLCCAQGGGYNLFHILLVALVLDPQWLVEGTRSFRGMVG